MLRYNDITNGLLHVVGWEQGYFGEVQIDNSLTVSESGIYFQQIHPLITLENIRSIAPEFSTVDSTEQQFSDWLTGKTKSSIYKAISRFCNVRASQQAYKQLVESKELFSGTGNIYNTEKPSGKLVGFEIVPIRSKGITTKIDRIGLQFVKSGTYTIYVFHSSSFEPLYVENFEIVKPNTFTWFTPSQDILLYNRDVDAGGSWYLVYAQTSMPQNSAAIIKNYDWSKKPCVSCSRINTVLYEAWSKYLEVHPFEVDMRNVPFDQDTLELRLWDIENNNYTYDTNHGINLCITVSCDITDFILNQKMLFADIIAKQVAIDMLREFAYNPAVRTNRHTINASRLDVLYALDGDSASMKKSGLCYDLETAIAALEVTLAGQDRICLPCANKGLKWTTV